MTPHGLGELEIDHALAIPAAVRDAVEGLARERFADTMFVDEKACDFASQVRVLGGADAEELLRMHRWKPTLSGCVCS